MSPRRSGSFAPPAAPVVAGLVLALFAVVAAHGPAIRAAAAQWPTWLNKPARPVRYPPLLVDATWVDAERRRTARYVVDARSPADYAAGHIPGAILAPILVGPPWGRFAGAEPRIPTAGIVILYGDARAPLAAGALHHWLCQFGDPEVRVLNGGFDAWRRAGLPVATGAAPQPPPPVTGSRKMRAPFLAWEERLGDPGLTILDARPAAAWEQGHIPFSLPFDFDELANDDGTLMDGPTMRSILATIGPRPRESINLEDAIVVVGFPGERSRVHPWTALKAAGIDTVILATVTMERWRDMGRPITRIVHSAEAVRIVADAHRGRPRDRPVPGLILFDTRHEPDFAASHLPGAVLLPPDRFAAQLDSVVAARWPGVDRATVPFAVYCYGPDCIRSRNATTVAARHGFRNLLWFRDGPQGFRAAGGKLYP
jgi:3-mercaptopyruvate sulfurtransferase SseA